MQGKFFVRSEGLKQELRLRLLALVLALALTWYAVNPAPGPVRRGGRDEGRPEGERRGASPAGDSAAELMPAGASTCAEAAADLDWPEFIDVD